MKVLAARVAGFGLVIAIVGVSAVLASSQTVTLNPGDSITADCPTNLSGTIGKNAARLVCRAVATATATATATLMPSSTRTPTPSPTPAGEDTPTPTPTTGSGGGGPFPLCAHDVTKWHGLVERNADGSIRCTYQHEHGSDPHVLDDVFGTLNSEIGQEIAFPWTTSSLENSDAPLTTPTADGRPWAGGKHRFFKWEVITSADLAAAGFPGCAPNPNAAFGFDNIRMEVHADANSGADVRFHSFYAEAEACSVNDPGFHGVIRIGGWFDYGMLFGLENSSSGQKDVRVPLPGIDPPETPYQASRRTHGTTAGSCGGCSAAARGDFTWYGANATPFTANASPAIGVSDGVRENDWGPIDPNNPDGPIRFYGPVGDPNNDHGWAAPLDIFAAMIPPASQLPGSVSHGNGSYSWTGFVDAHGNVVTGCTNWSVNCIPASLKNMRPGDYQYSNDETRLPERHFDVVVNGKTLIAFPN